ncbi:hypothetical protein HMPREF9371_0964 [Neisseria shayeganii 871]|uniref:Uncharacterized protein n=1 Tax=Neisseria shayeganii 871 TaxID=1032488 RepID=G4CH75_9NEIS|nr:hypothetical protein HMPREF9371_0964 [Neisseria shayeganii 871]
MPQMVLAMVILLSLHQHRLPESGFSVSGSLHAYLANGSHILPKT